MHLSCLGEPVFSRHCATSSTEIIDKILRTNICICLFLLDNSFSLKTHRDLSQKVVIISQLYTTVFSLESSGEFYWIEIYT